MTPQDQSIPCICGKLDCTVPYGTCHCGCGETTNIKPKSNTERGYITGEPFKFIRGHQRIIRRLDFYDADPFKVGGVFCKLIDLTAGFFSIVELPDYEILYPFLWIARYCKGLGKYYAHCTQPGPWWEKGTPLHRVIFHLQKWDKTEVDHLFGNTLDNRRSVLRVGTASDNRANQRKLRPNNTSGRKGVSYIKTNNRWTANIGVEGRLKYLGTFKTFEEACAVREEAEKLYYPWIH